jgi:GDPmannose 4,6-dehydratase
VGLEETLFLGNLDAKRDWGYAPEYVEGMWRILQHGQADDFVLATGETHSVRELVEHAFAAVDLLIEWRGAGVDEVGVQVGTDRVVVRVDPHYFRPTEVDLLIGDASKAKRLLGWEAKTTFENLVSRMVASDLDQAKREVHMGSYKGG